jgi:hypothetical protein
MPDLVRFVPLAVVCTLAACHRGSTKLDEPDPGSRPIAEVEGGGAELAIVAVPQLPAAETLEWLFEPGGRRMSSTEQGDCSIWDIETGRLIRSFDIESEPRECLEWLPAVTIDAFERPGASADGRLEFISNAGSVEIFEAESGNRVRDLACPKCDSAVAATWSASGHQIAFLWDEPLRLEIWDADTGKRVFAEPIASKGPLVEFALAWPQAGPFVALAETGEGECQDWEEECEFDEDGNPMLREVAVRRAVLASPQKGLVEIPLGSDQGMLYDLAFDPEGHWVFWTHSQDERRSGTTSWLFVEGLGDRQSGLGFEHFDEYDDYEGSMSREGHWRTDGATHWAVTIRYEDFEAGFSGMGWETTLTSPPLGRRSGEAITDPDAYEADAALDLYGFVGDAIRFSGEMCEGENCTPIGVAPPRDCVMLDIGSNHGAELFDCGGRVQLRNAAGMVPLPLDAGSAFWWWARNGALVIDDGVTFMVVDAASGRVGLQRDDVGQMLDGKLGPELDRVVVINENGFELLDLTNLGVVLAQPEPPMEVAFSPTGDRLALLGPDSIEVLEVPSGKSITKWSVQSIDQLAFRQDGKVVYVGSDVPQAGFDAATGEPLNDPLVFAKITEAIDQGGEIDPSWRWIMHDEFGELLRTIDGRTLEWIEGGAWLPDSGQYSGAGPGPSIAFRVGTDPWTVPEYDAQQLSKWLERPDLVEAFLTGKPIPKPTITKGELEGLKAKVKGSTK